ncbi:MAG: hypothetical protein ACI88A_000945 [Paraglaciecola sp.]|jgi:hypothetical protein
MTRFAKPDTVACPYCNQYYSRKVLLSFNNKWEITYSDGGSAMGLSDVLINETRCTKCCQIMLDVQDLPALNVAVVGPFWKTWFSQTPEYLYLPQATSDVYLELFKLDAEDDKKMQYALQAYRLFNRTYRQEDKNTLPSETDQQQYAQVASYILASPPAKYMPEYILLCADIHRQRGEFAHAQAHYESVYEDEFSHIVDQGLTWCDNKQTRLMIVKLPERHANARVAVV